MTTTTYLELDDQATGANNNTWGDVADANMAIIEQAIARYVAINTTGGTTTLTSAQNRYPLIEITGALVSNATITVKTQEKNWIFKNSTTGAFTVTVKTAAGSGKTLPRGRSVKLYCDGTNVEHARYSYIPMAQAGGGVDAITATFEPAFTSAELQDGTLFLVEAAGANTTTTPTFSPDGNTARTITKNGGQALVAGDIRAAGHKLLLCYDSSSTRYELLNPLSATDLSAYATTAAMNTAISTATLGKQTIWVPAAAMTARTTNGAAAGTAETTTNKVMFKTLDFDTTTQEFAQFAIRMPKGWNEGTLTFQAVWSHAATTVNFGVAWALEAVALSDAEAGDTAFGTAAQVTDTGGTTNMIYITAESSAMTVGSSPVAQDWVVFQVKRVPADAADTMAIDARLHGITLFYTNDAATDA